METLDTFSPVNKSVGWIPSRSGRMLHLNAMGLSSGALLAPVLVQGSNGKTINGLKQVPSACKHLAHPFWAALKTERSVS